MGIWAFRRTQSGLLASLFFLAALLTGCNENPSDSAMPPETTAPGTLAISPAELERLRALGYADTVETAPDTSKIGVQILDRQRVAPGYRLYVEHGHCRATLMDIEGNRIRQWSTSGCRRWAQAELLPGGDLLVPGLDLKARHDSNRRNDNRRYLMRFDWYGNLRWKARLPVHHDVEQRPDGKIVTLTRGSRSDHSFADADTVADNYMVLLSADGEEMESFSLWDVLKKNDIGFQLLEVAPDQETHEIDVVHANSLEFMRRPELVGRHPIYDLENVLVSMRHQDSIFVINYPERKLVWAWGQGELSSQHDAQVLDNGNILIFDNGIRNGWSRVVEMNPRTGKIVWVYGDADQNKFYSAARGSSQRLPNGNTLVTISNRGEVREVTAEGEVVWIFFSGQQNEKGKRDVIVRMHHFSPEQIAPLLSNSSH